GHPLKGSGGGGIFVAAAPGPGVRTEWGGALVGAPGGGRGGVFIMRGGVWFPPPHPPPPQTKTPPLPTEQDQPAEQKREPTPPAGAAGRVAPGAVGPPRHRPGRGGRGEAREVGGRDPVEAVPASSADLPSRAGARAPVVDRPGDHLWSGRTATR